jgi:hypothetical protein
VRAVRSRWTHVVSVLLLCSVLPAPVLAVNQGRAGINLGSTSFFDGFGRSTEGFTYQSYFQVSDARTIMSGDQQNHAFHNPRIDSFVWTHQLSYYLPTSLWGGRIRPAFNVLLPLVGYATHFDASGIVLRDNGIGLSDLVIGPMFQFRPLQVDGRDVFSHRIEVDVVAPVGKYDAHKNLNQSSNYVSINPHWSLTVVPLPGLELSARVQYLWSAPNERPVNVPKGLQVDTARAGQSVWSSFTASFEIFRGLHVGANGYFLRQLTADRYRLLDGSHTLGTSHGDGKAQVLGIGPGLLWDASKSDRLFGNFYHQLLVHDRPEANVLNVRWLHNF